MTDRFEEAREQFKALSNQTYLNWAGTGPMPSASVKAVEELIDALYEYNGASLPEMRHHIPVEAKEQLARLINAKTENIAITGTSTTQGVQAALNAVNPSAGQSIVTGDLQYVLTETEMQKWKKKGVSLKVVKNRNGVYDAEDFSGEIDENTAVVLLDSVTWINGYRFDIAEISKIAHENGAVMITDSIQHVGQMPLDTKTFGADIIVGSAQKWLSDILGVGYSYVSDSIVKKLERPYYGYGNTVEPEGGWPEYFTNIDRPLFGDFEFRNSDATILEYGGSLSNLGGLAALSPSLKLINGIGPFDIYSRIMGLKGQLVSELELLGMNLVEPLDENHQSGITTFSTGLGAQKDIEIVGKLSSMGIVVSYRAGAGIGGIRVSTHYVNNSSDIENFIDGLKKFIS